MVVDNIGTSHTLHINMHHTKMYELLGLVFLEVLQNSSHLATPLNTWKQAFLIIAGHCGARVLIIWEIIRVWFFLPFLDDFFFAILKNCHEFYYYC